MEGYSAANGYVQGVVGSAPGWMVEMHRRMVDRIVLSGREHMRPMPDRTVSEWAEQVRVLPETVSEAGRWSNKRAPHLKEIMDTFNDKRVREVSIMKSAQAGGTEALLNIVGYMIDHDPCAAVFLQPSDNDAKDFVTEKLDSMIRDTETLARKVFKARGGGKKEREGRLLRKKFPGGFLHISGAITPRATRQRSARLTFVDDLDGIGKVAEGDVVRRLKQRGNTFPDHLHYSVSTPTIEGESRIELAYNSGSKAKYNVRCRKCEHEQVLKWENLTWAKDYDALGKPVRHYYDTVRVKCGYCSYEICEAERLGMLERGRWVHEKPWMMEHRSYWIDQLSSTLANMQKIAEAIVEAGEDAAQLESLYNTVLGLPYKRVRGKEVDPLELMAMVRDEPVGSNAIANGVYFLTAAVDLQDGSVTDEGKPQRFEVEVHGWGYQGENWLVDKLIIPASFAKKADWGKLDAVWERQWKRLDGNVVPILRKFVDSSHRSEMVYEYVRGREHEGIYAIKGSSRVTAHLMPRGYSKVDKGRVNLLVIGTQHAKHEVFARLDAMKEQRKQGRLEPGPRFIHLPRAFCDAEYFRQLTAEKLLTTGSGLFEQKIWVKTDKGRSNEALDLRVYNYAAMKHVVPNWEKLKVKWDRVASAAPVVMAGERKGEKPLTLPSPEGEGIKRNNEDGRPEVVKVPVKQGVKLRKVKRSGYLYR
jgi:phage terminase large subunit GpA-like protein